MKLNFKFAPFLATIIFLSKEILVFNEETLILFSFCLFVYLSFNFIGNMIYDQLNQYSSEIEQTFLHYDLIEKEIFLNSTFFYQNQKSLSVEIENILFFIKETLSFLNNKYSFLLNKYVYNFIEVILKRHMIFEKKLKYDTQQYIVDSTLLHSLEKFKSKKLDHKLFIKSSIVQIKKK